jgi:hypothetical protein
MSTTTVLVSGKETNARSVTNTETNVMEAGPITVVGGNRVRINSYVEVVKDAGTTSRLATVRIRRRNAATVRSTDTLVAESRVQLIGVANAPANIAINCVDTPGDGTFYYALMGQNGNFAITYEDKSLLVEEIGPS